MSKVDLNALVNGFSGKLGNAVLRRRGSRTYITQRPKERLATPSEKQKAQTERFKRAAAYAKSRMADPAMREEYELVAKRLELMNAFTVAVKDYLVLPKIDSVKTDKYKGVVNDVIAVKVADDFKVIAVDVAIHRPDGTLLESGAAAFDAVSLEWKYSATVANVALAGSTIKVTALDRPGNEASMQVVI